VGVAIAEFGTGYSSMSTLHRVPGDKIKIDPTSFLRTSITSYDGYIAPP